MPKLLSKLISLLLLCTTFFTFTASPVLASVTYLYDANGNMTSDGTNCYTYNNSNQLSQIKNCTSNQVIAQYLYDYQGNRVEKKLYTSGTLSQTVYSPDKTYETTKIATNGATQNTSYYYFRDEVLAKKNPDGTKNFYVTDNLHSTSLLTNQTGTVIESSSYFPFGQVRAGGTQGKYFYTGQQSDSESGLDYYVARYYNPQIRRFTQPDDVIPDVYNPQTLNRYSYVNNNPLTYTDPSGHCPLCVPLLTGVVGAALGVAGQYLSNPRASLKDYGKAATVGFIAGAVAPIFEAGFAGATAATLAKTAVPAAAGSLISRAVGVVASSVGTNVIGNIVSGEDPKKSLFPQVGSDVVTGMVTNYLTDGLIPMQGRVPSIINPVRLGTNSLKQVGNEALQGITSEILGNMVTTPFNSASVWNVSTDQLKNTYLNQK